jgi:hypothetical protein
MAWLLVFVIPVVVLGALLFRREHRGSRGVFETPQERQAAAGRRADMDIRAAHTRGIVNTNGERGGFLN